MIKYIVSWVVLSYVSVPCPDNKTDEFGRRPESSCLVNHVEIKCEKFQRGFKSKSDADYFYNYISKAQPNQFNKIDSLKIQKVK